MDIFKMLDLLEKVEASFSDLYEKLHEKHGGNEKAAQFFSDMQTEEDQHLQIVRMERRLVQASPKVFSEPYVNLSELNDVLEKTSHLKEAALELPELIKLIYCMEKSSAENYLIDALQETNDDIREFLLNLGSTFVAHRDKILDFAEDLGVRVEDSQDIPLRKPRIGFSAKVLINETTAVQSVDISEGGMFLLTGRSFPVGKTLTLRFDVLNVTLSTEAVVQFNIAGTGMGVKFTELASNRRDLIRNYVTQRLEEKATKIIKRVLLVGSVVPTGREIMKVYMNTLLSAGYRVMDISGFEETVNSLMKEIDLSCIILAVEMEQDANYHILHYISTLERYKDLPLIVFTNSQNKQFRDKLVKKGAKKLLSRTTTSPKRLAEEVKSLTG